MTHFTDLKSETAAPAEQISPETARVLLAVAAHFTRLAPTDTLEPHSVLIACSTEAYRLTNRSIGGGAQTLAQAALAVAPHAAPGTTRGEYALLLRRTVADAGYGWDDDNEPVIPGASGLWSAVGAKGGAR